MPLVTSAHLLGDAYASGTAIGAFNVVTLEHAEAIATGAERAGCPVILQFSQNCAAYHAGDLRPLMAASAEVARSSLVAMSLHLDHVEDDRLLRETVALGASSVMYDASALDYDDNVRATRIATEWAHQHGLMLEAELGEIGGKTHPHDPSVRTDPDEAAAFVEATGVDALAVAVGSSHAMTSRSAVLDLARVGLLRRSVPVPLVLHGSSGVAPEALRDAVGAGMTKINVGTALNIALTGAVREALAGDVALIDPRTYLGAGRTAMVEGVQTHLSELR